MPVDGTRLLVRNNVGVMIVIECPLVPCEVYTMDHTLQDFHDGGWVIEPKVAKIFVKSGK